MPERDHDHPASHADEQALSPQREDFPEDADPAERQVPPGFRTACADFGIELADAEIDRLARYLNLLLETNARFNLTSVKSWEDAWTKHIFDSLTLLAVLNELRPAQMIDVGSGGGLPGIPIAIAMPGVEVTLLEATGKKARFLEEAVRVCELSNVRVVNQRAEEAATLNGPLREQYDVVTARAVGRLNVLLELTVPFARIGGIVVATKGEQADAEVAEAKKAVHALHAAHLDTVQTPTGRLVVIEKRRSTPRMYPRRPGEPKRAPLK